MKEFKLIASSQRAKDLIQSHGDVMEYIQYAYSQGKLGVLLKSLKPTLIKEPEPVFDMFSSKSQSKPIETPEEHWQGWLLDDEIIMPDEMP